MCTLSGQDRVARASVTGPVSLLRDPQAHGCTGARVGTLLGARPPCRCCGICCLTTSRRSGPTWRHAGRHGFLMPQPQSCWPISSRSRPARTPPHWASTSCMWPSARKPNSGRSDPASSTTARQNGRSCRFPEGRIVVDLDGDYVRNWENRKTNFELIVGRSMPEDRGARYVGLVHGYDLKSKRRLFDLLKSQGLQANQDVTFLTDGGEEVRATNSDVSRPPIYTPLTR
jgi:hypothetical protein